MIYIEPIGGLCNRMRSVLAAYYYAQDHNNELTIIWWAHDECNCRFSDIFDIKAIQKKSNVLINVVEIPYIGENEFARRVRHFIKNRVTSWYKRKCDTVIEYAGKKIGENIKSKDVYISSFEKWCDSEDNYSFFVFNKELYEKSDKMFINDGSEYIGVHIRRTDNTVSIKESSVDLFFEEIDKSDSKIYIASDDDTVRQEFVDRYGVNRVFLNTSAVLKRNSKKGIKDAAIDLLNLSKCDRILGSYYSSFSDVAALIGNKELLIVKKK